MSIHSITHSSARDFLVNLAVLLGSVALAFLLLEFVVCKYILIPSEYPSLDSRGTVLKYTAGERGTYRVKDEIKAVFSINANGWNSGHPAYFQDKEKKRIAIVGDSFLAAFMVDHDTSIAERLEAESKGNYEVYRFGIDGAPLSQYLYMLRHEVMQYTPDVVVFNLVHNDFDESYRHVPGVYTSAFMKLELNEGKVVGEIDPIRFTPPWYSWFRKSNLWRYVAVRRQVRFQPLRSILLGSSAKTYNPAQYQANIDISNMTDVISDNEVATRYLLEQARDLCRANNALFLVVMDGVRYQIYQTPEGPFDYSTGALRLNKMVADVAQDLDIPFIDLHPIFAAHYREHGRRFEFPHDAHWNELGHAVAASALAQALNFH